MLRSCGLVIAASIFCGAIGLAVSYLISAPTGAAHSCPAGASPSDCTYPPDQFAWSVGWVVGGVIVGLIIGVVVGLRYGSRAE
jgi:hypothetical protein